MARITASAAGSNAGTRAILHDLGDGRADPWSRCRWARDAVAVRAHGVLGTARARRVTPGSCRSCSPSSATSYVGGAVDHKPKSTTRLARLADIARTGRATAARRALRGRLGPAVVGADERSGRPSSRRTEARRTATSSTCSWPSTRSTLSVVRPGRATRSPSSRWRRGERRRGDRSPGRRRQRRSCCLQLIGEYAVGIAWVGRNWGCERSDTR